MNKHLALLLMFGIIFIQGNAQDSLNGNVIITSKYKPQIRDSRKLAVPPRLETPPISGYPFLYQPRLPNFNVHPTPAPLKVLALNAPKPEKLNGNYARLGFGNFSSPFAEISFTNLRSDRWAVGTMLRHFSLNGKTPSRKWHETEGMGWIKYFTGTQVFEIRGGYGFQQWQWYGLPSSSLDTFSQKDSLRHWNQTGQLSFSLEKPQVKSTDLTWNIYAGYQALQDKYRQTEHQFKWGGGTRSLFHHNILDVGIQGQVSGYRDLINLNRTLTRLHAAYALTDKAFTLKLGFQSYFQTMSRDTPQVFRFFFFPTLQGEYRIISNKLMAFLNLDGQRIMHELGDLYTQNPFLKRGVYLDNHSQIQIMGGIKGKIWQATAYVVSIGSINFKNAPLFIQIIDSALPDFTDPYRRFQVYYTDYRDLFARFEFSHQYKDVIETRLTAVFHRYSQADETFTPSHLPNIEAKLHNRIKFQEKLQFSADLYLMSMRNAALGNLKLQKTSYEPIRGVTDISVGADYKYSNAVSIWMKVNNFTASRYQRWYQYPVAGILFQLGVKITL